MNNSKINSKSTVQDATEFPDQERSVKRGKHVLFTKETCGCDKTNDAPCSVCDGGLAVCSVCMMAEAELDAPCRGSIGNEESQRSVKQEEKNSGNAEQGAEAFPELNSSRQDVEAAHTPTPWVVQQLNHVNDELWLQIGWIENGHEIGPVCELVGGAVNPSPSFKVVAEFKYLVASDSEVRANAQLIVKAVNSHEALYSALFKAKETIRIWHGEAGWDIYDTHSPEMKAINAALDLVESEKGNKDDQS